MCYCVDIEGLPHIIHNNSERVFLAFLTTFLATDICRINGYLGCLIFLCRGCKADAAQGKKGRMGQKDITEKQLEEYNDVFADIYNVLVFEKKVIDESRLRDGTTESHYKDDSGQCRDQRRDVMKTYLDKYRMELAFIGIDNQTEVDKYIPVRVLGYDYGKYRRQVDEKKFPLVPVITLVLNLSNTRWNGCKSLADITNIPKEFEPHFQDYKVKVVDVAFLEDAVIEKFTSDFKLVAKFFKNKRLKVKFVNDGTEIKHVAEVLDFITAFTNDPRYENVKEDMEELKQKGEKVAMCEYLDMYIEEGLQRGLQAGRKEGEQMMAKLMGCLLADNLTEEMQQALTDEEARAKLYAKYGITEDTDAVVA